MALQNELEDRVRELRHEHHLLTLQYAEAKRRVSAYARRSALSSGQSLECRAMQRIKNFRKNALDRVSAELSSLEHTLAPENEGTRGEQG